MSLPLRIDLDEKPVRIGIAVAAVAVIGVLAGAALYRGWHGAPAAAPIVYVCSETGEAFRLPFQGIPGVNPKTGRRTLFRGAYCQECNQWHAVPAPNHQAGNPKAASCPVHHVPMTFDGPAELASSAP